MAIFESRQRKLFRSIKALSDAGAVDQAATRVEQELKVLIESPEIARELVAFLMDIAYPDLAARAGEDIIRMHRDLAAPVLRLLEERQADFPRSFELLRTLWQIKLRQRDFSGAIELLNKVDRTAEQKLYDSLETAARNADRFAADKLLEGDLDRFVSYALVLQRRGRTTEALETLLRAAQRASRPDDRIPALVEWIGTRKGDREPQATLYLVRVYLAAENVDQALRNIPDLFDAPEDIVTQAVPVIEKDLLPLDLTSKGRIFFARLLAAAGRFDDAARELERLLADGETGAELDAAVRDLATRASDSARPFLLLARFKKARNENTAALDAMEQAFDKDDAQSSSISEVASAFLGAGIDRDNTIARKLALLQVEHGSVTEGVEALCRLVTVDPEWVQGHIQKLLLKDKNSAEILTLLAVVMQVRGRESEASVTMKHLYERKDRKSREDIVQVLSRFDSLMEKHPGLRRMRASIRGVAGREGEAATDWFSLMLNGEHVPDEGLDEIEQAGLHKTRASELVASSFSPETPREALLAGIAALVARDYAKVDRWLVSAAKDPVLAARAAEQVAILSDETLAGINLQQLLPGFAESGASKTVADIILRTRGADSWRMDLVSRLQWGDRQAEVLFRLRAYLAEGRVALAGTALGDSGVTDAALAGLAEFCRLVSEGSLEAALQVLPPAVEDRRTSALAAGVLLMIVVDSGGLEASLRRMLSTAHSTDGHVREAALDLEPVLGMPGVTDLLEDLATENPGMVEAPMLLVRTAAIETAPERLRKYSGMVLDIDPGKAAEIETICERLGNEKASGQCLVLAAELSDRFHLQADPEQLLTKAVLTEPAVAKQVISRKGAGPALRALCYLASGNAAGFSDVMRRRQNLEIPVTAALADTAIASWSASSDGEALTFLVQVLYSAGMAEKAAGVLSSLARDGLGAWRASAATRLMQAALEGKASRKLFWDSVRDSAVVQEALDGPLGEGMEERPTDELVATSGALLACGVETRRAIEFGRLLSGRDGTRARLRDIASYCFEKWKKGDRHSDEDLVQLLLDSEMRGEASEVALSTGRDEILGQVMSALETHRTGADASSQSRARSLIYAGSPAAALEAIAESSDPEALDLRALALWRMGRRNSAISAWLDAYRNTQQVSFMRRLHWALGEAGYRLDQIAVEKFLETHNPAALAGLSRDHEAHGHRLNVISHV